MSGDNGLRLALTLADGELAEVLATLEDHYDVEDDRDGAGVHANWAMRAGQQVERVRAALARIASEVGA